MGGVQNLCGRQYELSNARAQSTHSLSFDVPGRLLVGAPPTVMRDVDGEGGEEREGIGWLALLRVSARARDAFLGAYTRLDPK